MILLGVSRAERVQVIGRVHRGVNLIRGYCFHDRDHLIEGQAAGIVRLQVDGTNRPNHEGISGQANVATGTARSPLLVAPRDEICVLIGMGRWASYFDANSLQGAGERRELTGMAGTALWGSADNTCHALGSYGLVYAVTRQSLALQRLADRPQTGWLPRDLPEAREAAAVLHHYPGVGPLHELLVGCLEHRFGGEVRLGWTASAADGLAVAADDDIAVGEVSNAE
jgi:hypothetical protein